MRRPTRPQRPALAAGKLIVHPPELHCKLFFSYILAFLCALPTVLRFCIVFRQLYCYATQRPFLVCWCCRLRELSRRRRESRFKRRLLLRLSCWSVCVFARVFATLGGFMLPSAAAAALLPESACCRCAAAARRRGYRVLKVPRWGGCHLSVQF